jgi:hypothetical protein
MTDIDGGPKAEIPTARESAFVLLFRLGAVLFVFGSLLQFSKGDDGTPDLIIFAAAACLAFAALVVGRGPWRTRLQWRSGALSSVILLAELLISLNAIGLLIANRLHRGP